jgi:hypothetical protein
MRIEIGEPEHAPMPSWSLWKRKITEKHVESHAETSIMPEWTIATDGDELPARAAPRQVKLRHSFCDLNFLERDRAASRFQDTII